MGQFKLSAQRKKKIGMKQKESSVVTKWLMMCCILTTNMSGCAFRSWSLSLSLELLVPFTPGRRTWYSWQMIDLQLLITGLTDLCIVFFIWYFKVSILKLKCEEDLFGMCQNLFGGTSGQSQWLICFRFVIACLLFVK